MEIAMSVGNLRTNELERLYSVDESSIKTNNSSDYNRGYRRSSSQVKRIRRDRKIEKLNTLLLDAAGTDNLDECIRLLNEGANCNAKCRESGATALMVAAAWGHERIVHELLTRGASPLLKDNHGRTPAHVAAARGNVDVLKELIKFQSPDIKPKEVINAKVEKTEGEVNDSFDSWLHSHETVLPNMPDLPDGSTPLHAASQWSEGDCVKLLLDNGADPEILDSRGLTPLDVAGEILHRKDEDNDVIFRTGSDVTDIEDRTSSDTDKSDDGTRLRPISNFYKKSNFTPRIEKSSSIPTPYIAQSIKINVEEDKESSSDEEKSRTSTRKVIENLLVASKQESKKNEISGPTGPGRSCLLPESRYRPLKSKKLTTCLFNAVKARDEELVKILLKKNYDVLQFDSKGRTPAHVSVNLQDLGVLSILLNKKEAVNARDSQGRTLLYLAVQNEWRAGVDFLLNANADIKLPANDGSTVIHAAASKMDSVLLEELFTFDDAFEVVNQVDGKQQTPLCCAVAESSTSCVECLLKHGASPNIIQPGEITLLHVASRNGCEEILKLLLESGADILIEFFNEPREGGMTPLHVACKEGNRECVLLLLSSGADVLIKTKTHGKPYYGATPLHLAARYGHFDVAKILIDHDKTVMDQYNDDKWQPLHVAARFGKTECVRLFLQSGGHLASEVSDSNGYRKTALDVIVNFIPKPVEFLQEIFDSFISTNEYPVTHVDCIVTFNYDLFSPISKENRKQLPVLDAVINSPKLILQEEVFQASRLQRYYWRDVESWVKWSTFVLVGWLSFPEFDFENGLPSCYTNTASIAVLLAWLELLFLLSRLPKWGFNVLMFSRVAQKVIKVLATFGFIFIGFMFSFMIEFRSQKPFNDIWRSFVKVIVMTSELEYTDMFENPVESTLIWTVVARCLLLSFVILITIVLMNLMVGLAVNDISLLEAQGRTRRLAKQVTFLTLIELFVYNNCILNTLPGFIRRTIKKWRAVPLKLTLRTGKPHKYDMKRFPLSLRNAILDKASKIQKTDDNVELKQLTDKIDQLLIKQDEKNKRKCGSSFSIDSDNSKIAKLRGELTLSTLQQIINTLNDLKNEINELKTRQAPKRIVPKWNKALYRKPILSKETLYST
ncbi:uncharacterized protein LOC142328462 isoform X2 [Lycorma delicatula]|uniref:uncharacterized protein LOC142328462 isoform X2 n=1 Tax=Lycorma delicatula TaxID=130591 RepID=UPI003F513AE6